MEEALQIFQDMVARNCERNVITYSSLISACEKAGRWQLALELFDEMHRDSCKPNVVTFNALIAACGQGTALSLCSLHWSYCAVRRFCLCAHLATSNAGHHIYMGAIWVLALDKET